MTEDLPHKPQNPDLAERQRLEAASQGELDPALTTPELPIGEVATEATSAPEPSPVSRGIEVKLSSDDDDQSAQPATQTRPKNLDDRIRTESGEEDSRWDYDKAYAMAGALQSPRVYATGGKESETESPKEHIY